MIFNSNRIISISSQPDKFSYEFLIAGLNQSGNLTLGFSGQSGNYLNYTFQSGKIYDSDGDFVYSYGNNIGIWANVESDTQSYFINGIPVKLRQTLPNIGQVDSFYVNPVNMTPDITFSFLGEQPSFEISTFQFNETNPTGIGYIMNTDSEKYFRLYSGVFSSSDYTYMSGFPGVLNPGESGAILVRKNFDPSDAADFSNSTTSLPLTIYTNFGSRLVDPSGQNNFSISQNITFDFDPQISGSGTFNNFFYWQNQQGLSSYTAETLPISFAFSRVTGDGDFTGNWNLLTGFNSFPISYQAVPFDGGSQSYSGNFNTLGASGLAFAIQRPVSSGNTGVFEFTVNGFTQNVTILFTGV